MEDEVTVCGVVNKSTKCDYSLNESISLVDRNHYQTPLAYRYGSEEMSYNFSDLKKFSIWRWLWVYLAKAQKELGLPITEEMVSEMQEHIEDIDFELIEEEERQCRHDVLAHIHEFSSKCPRSAHIIHLGASSCFVGDNTDLIVMRDAFDILLPKLASCLDRLSAVARQHVDLPILSYTHLQPAGVTTLGKRFSLWMADLLLDFQAMQRVRNQLKFRGCKGNTGTQSSFLELFDGDKEKVRQLDERVTQLAGFPSCYTICGQSYSRKVDSDCLSVLAGLGVSVHKMCTDIRLLSAFGQLEEPLGDAAGGDSAVGGSTHHKRNPLKSERCCSLSRHLWTLATNAVQTAASQWMERTMDDSALRRISIPEAFLTADVILQSLQGLCSGLVVRKAVIAHGVKQELPFLIAGQLVSRVSALGGNPEEARIRLKKLQKEASAERKELGAPVDLEQRIRSEEVLAILKGEFDELFDPRQHVGCSVEQVDYFLRNELAPAISQFSTT